MEYNESKRILWNEIDNYEVFVDKLLKKNNNLIVIEMRNI
jgi:hypothetical protein